MSVLIKTMTDLPEHCYECPCHDGESGYCQADKEHRYSDYRPFWCPLVKDDVRNDAHAEKVEKWIEEITYMECPNCNDIWHYEENQTERFKFCPSCGEKMQEVEE